MRLNTAAVRMGALLVAIGLSQLPVEAGQRDNRGRDRNGRESQGQTRERQGGQTRERQGGNGRSEERATPPQADENRGAREQPRAGRPDDGLDSSGRDRTGRASGENRRGEVVPRAEGRRSVPDQRAYGGGAPGRRDDDRYRDGFRYRDDYRYDGYRRDGYRNDGYRYDGYRYYGSPRYGAWRPRRYYGPGGDFSVYFGFGSGYRYGFPYSGRVYGYLPPRAYGARVYYGDVRLQVQPRDAAVYVDGYYAGIVDDFDGVFQHLTLEVGPHLIELEAPGLEPQVFEVYVDPARTVNIRADLFRY